MENNSKVIKGIKKAISNTFDIYYKNNLICFDADNFSVFENKVLAIVKIDYLFVYEINENFARLKSAIKRDGPFENALVFIDEFRYIVDFNCKITCLGRY